MFFHSDSAYPLRTLSASIARDVRNTLNMKNMLFICATTFKQQKKKDKMSSFSCTGFVLYNAPERGENEKVKIIRKFSIKIYNET